MKVLNHFICVSQGVNHVVVYPEFVYVILVLGNELWFSLCEVLYDACLRVPWSSSKQDIFLI